MKETLARAAGARSAPACGATIAAQLFAHGAARPPQRCRRNASWPLVVVALLTGCGQAAQGPARAPQLQAPVTRVPRVVVTPESTTTIPEMYTQALALQREAKHAEAAALLDRVVQLDGDGEYADEALFQAGAEHDQAGAFELAAARYEQFAVRYPDAPLSTTALVRATRLLAHLEQWERAGALGQRLLGETRQLGPFEAVVAYAASANARLWLDDEVGAAAFIEKGRAIVEAQQLDAAGRVSADLAGLYYALGELRRRRAERIVFDPMPENFTDALERRCQLLLDAQSAYSDAMRAYEAHWSAMAGFRVGELYQRLHEDLMQVKPPASANSDEKRALFEGAMRLRYAILLEKASGMLQHTLAMTERTGERSGWVQRAAKARATIEAARRREQAAIDKLPYSRATLDAALADVARRAQSKSSASPAGGAKRNP